MLGMSNLRPMRKGSETSADFLSEGTAPAAPPAQTQGTRSIEQMAAVLLGTAAEMAKRSAACDSNADALSPSATFAERLLQERRLRTAFLDGSLFGEPVWDLLLDLYVSEDAGKPVSVSSACIAAGVPATTALRYIETMLSAGLIRRESSSTDRRTCYVQLTSTTRQRLSDLLLWMAEGRRVPRTIGEAPDPVEQPEG